MTLKATVSNMQILTETTDRNYLNSYFCYDSYDYGLHGIAYTGAACDKSGWAVNIIEYCSDSDTNSELKTARIFAAQIGRNIGMEYVNQKLTDNLYIWLMLRSDSHRSHGGQNNPCNGKGLMSYGDVPDKWTSCSNSDFKTWFQEFGHECLKPSTSIKHMF